MSVASAGQAPASNADYSDKDLGWRPIEILLGGATEWLSKADYSVCEVLSRRQRYLIILDQYRRLSRAAQKYLDPMKVISLSDQSRSRTCDAFEPALAQAKQMLKEGRAEINRMGKTQPPVKV